MESKIRQRRTQFMKRKALAALLAASMVLTLGACGSAGGDTGSSSSGSSEDSEGKAFSGVSIEVDIEDSIQGSKETLEYFNKEVEAFCDETGAEIEVVQNGGDHENILKTRMASQDMPDMWITHGWASLRYSDFCEDLSGEEWVGRVDEAVKSVITDKNGKICTAPLTQWVYGIIYNADVMEDNEIDPQTFKSWDDVFAACEKLKSNNITPCVIGGKNGGGLPGHMEQLNSFYSAEKAPYEDREALLDGSFDWTKNTQFLDMYAKIYDNGWLNDDIFTADTTTAQKYLGTGEYGFMLWGSPDTIATVKSYSPEANFGIIPVPAVEEGANAAYTVGEGTCFAISNATENKDCCKAFLNYLLDKDHLTEYCEINGGMPGLTDIEPEDSATLKLYQTSVENAEDHLVYTNFFDREYLPSGMWNIMQETMSKLFNGDVGSAKDRVKEAAEYFQENYEALSEASAS